MTATMTESQCKQDLRAARAILSGPERWTTGTNARDANGCAVSPLDSRAASWCLAGSLIRITPPEAPERYSVCANHIICHLPKGYSITKWQDDPERTFDDIAHLLDTAIESAP